MAALALAAAGCAEEVPGAPPPLDRLYFPTAAALTEPAGETGQLLLVVSSNFDLRYRSGVLHALDVDAIDALVDPAVGGDEPVRVPTLDGLLVDSVEIGDFGGQLAVTAVGDRQRAFIPIRSGNRVTAVDVFPGTGGETLRCAQQGEVRCEGVRFPRRDPFSAVAQEGNVYVGHIGRDNDDDPVGAIGAARADAPFWSQGEDGDFELIGLGSQPVGGIAAGACREIEGARTCTLFATGRSIEQDYNPVFLFDFRENELRSGPVFSLNVYGQQRGLDSRGIGVSGDGNEIYVASRFPDALATIDVSRIEPQPPDGCVVPPGEDVPPEGSCPPGPIPVGGEATPRFVTADLVPVPPEPNTVEVIPRTLPDGSSSDLVIVTNASGLYLFDTRTGLPAGAIEGVGSAPNSLAVRVDGEGGARLYVPSFGFGTLAVVDIPDLLRPASARVVGILGSEQEGAF